MEIVLNLKRHEYDHKKQVAKLITNRLAERSAIANQSVNQSCIFSQINCASYISCYIIICARQDIHMRY